MTNTRKKVWIRCQPPLQKLYPFVMCIGGSLICGWKTPLGFQKLIFWSKVLLGDLFLISSVLEWLIQLDAHFLPPLCCVILLWCSYFSFAHIPRHMEMSRASTTTADCARWYCCSMMWRAGTRRPRCTKLSARYSLHRATVSGSPRRSAMLNCWAEIRAAISACNQHDWKHETELRACDVARFLKCNVPLGYIIMDRNCYYCSYLFNHHYSLLSSSCPKSSTTLHVGSNLYQTLVFLPCQMS